MQIEIRSAIIPPAQDPQQHQDRFPPGPGHPRRQRTGAGHGNTGTGSDHDPVNCLIRISPAGQPGDLFTGNNDIPHPEFSPQEVPPQGSLVSALITEAALFLLFTGIIFALIRSGIAGIRVEKTLPGPCPLIALRARPLAHHDIDHHRRSTLPGPRLPSSYMAGGSLLAAYLWHSGVMTRKIVLGTTALSTLDRFCLPRTDHAG